MNKIDRNATFGARVKQGASGAYDEQPVSVVDRLAAQLSAGIKPMRSKQAVFYPKRLVMFLAAAFNSAPPPALVVQFDKYGRRSTFPVQA